MSEVIGQYDYNRPAWQRLLGVGAVALGILLTSDDCGGGDGRYPSRHVSQEAPGMVSPALPTPQLTEVNIVR